MKVLEGGKVYNTDKGYLLKSVSRIEDLGEGYLRSTVCNLYSRKQDGDYFLHIKKISTDSRDMVIDEQDYIYPCSEGFVKRFNRKYDDINGVS